MQSDTAKAPSGQEKGNKTVMGILLALCAGHMINDTLQSLLPSIYPILKQSFGLTFAQIGFITLSFQLTASILQPVVGQYTDRYPKPFSLAVGMGVSLVGLALLSQAASYHMILVSAVVVGMGSAIFHPEASRVAHMAAGSRKGFAQAIFQTGGNLGSSLGPLLAGLIIVKRGQGSIMWFTALAFCGIVLLTQVGRWYRAHMVGHKKVTKALAENPLPQKTVIVSLVILLVLMFSKFFYLVSLTNYYTFFLIQKFGVSVQNSQFLLFVFMFAVAAGTIAGGALGDRFGRKFVIWASILGIAPFTLVLPHVGLVPTVILTVFIGFVLASAFPAILVFAQDLVPGKVGTIAGLFFGLAFGLGGIASATLGKLADLKGIMFVFDVCGYLPLIGLLTWFLPNMKNRPAAAPEPVLVD